MLGESPQSAWAANIPVTTTDDDYNINPGTCSLREAVTAANTDAAFGGCLAGSGDDVIEIPSGTYSLTLAGANEDSNLTGDLDISTPMEFSGAGAATTIVDGLLLDRVFHVTASDVNLNLIGLTVQNGLINLLGTGGGGAWVSAGGANLVDSVFLSNTANSFGGGLYATQDVTVINTSFISNTSSDILIIPNNGGGGLYTVNGSVLISNSLFISNTASGSGGGVFAAQNVTVTNSPFVSNTASQGLFITPFPKNGGGIYSQLGSVTINNSLFMSNTSGGAGGGVYAGQGITITTSPFISNKSLPNGFFFFIGGGGGAFAAGGPASITDSPFVANSAAGPGGGLYAGQGAMLMNSPFISNTSTFFVFPGDGGGAYVVGPLLISGSDFLSNTAQGLGGGVVALQALAIDNASFINNTSLTLGGGVYAAQASTLENVSFISNTTSVQGGGIYAAQDVTITYLMFESNQSLTGSGGGIYAASGAASISQTAFISNASALGGGAFFGPDRSDIVNSLFAANLASAGGSAIHIEGLTKTLTLTHVSIAQPVVVTGTAIVISGTDSSALIRNTIIASHTVGVEAASGNTGVEDYNLFFGNDIDLSGIAIGANSLVGDPAFADPASNDYHLTAGSAAIGKGLDLGITPDFDGNPRPAGVAPAIGFVQFNDVEIAGLSASNDSPKPENTPVQFTASITAGTNVSYAWAFGDGQSGTGITPTHSYAVAGTYTAIVTATNSTSTVETTTLVTVTDTPIAGLAASNNSPQFVNTAVQFTASITAGTNVGYVWNFGDGQTGTGATPTHSYAVAGTYTAIVTATNTTNTVTATTLVTITTNNNEVAIAGLTASNNSPQLVNAAVQFTATVTAGTNVGYAWNFGDNQTGTGANPTHSYAVAGTYVAVVTGTNELGHQTATTFVVITGPANAELAGALTAKFDGSLITYTLVVSNPNPGATATNVIVSGSVPIQTALISTNGISATTGGDYGNGYVQQGPVDLAPGEQVTLTWTVRMTGATGDIITRGQARSDNAEINQGLALRIYRLLLQIILNQASVTQAP